MAQTPTEPDPGVEGAERDLPEFSDAALADHFLRLHGQNVRFIEQWAKWIVWSDTRWIFDSTKSRVTDLAKDVSSDLFFEAAASSDSTRIQSLGGAAVSAASRFRLNAIVSLAQHGVLTDANTLDANPWLLGVANGYVDLQTGEYHLPNRDQLITRHSPIAYDSEATCPLWEESLAQWLPGGELADYFQRLVGEAVCGSDREHLLVIHYGTGANGKSTAMGTLAGLLGPYFATPHRSVLVQQRYEQHPTAYADLFRVRLALAVETENRNKLSEASAKNLTGGDPIKARRMREDFWEFEPTHTLWLSTNYLPEIAGRDDGIWRRIKVVPWDAIFDGESRDLLLRDRLRHELPGVLNWAIAGALKWQREGLGEPDQVVSASSDYREKEDVLGRYAAVVGLTRGPELETTAKELSESLRYWCKEEGIKPPSGRDFADWLRTLGATSGRRNNSRFWRGVGLPR